MKSLLNLWGGKDKPFTLVHFITHRCNARCRHCFIDFDNKDYFQNELTLEEIRKLTRHLGGCLYNVNLTGGEPFLREDIFEIAEAYFQNAGIASVYITTNGAFTERTRNFIDRFLDSKIKGSVVFSISLDNFEQPHDHNRGVAGLFHDAFRTIQMIRGVASPRIMAGVNITIADHNYQQVIELYRYLRKTGIEDIVVTPLREEGVVQHIDSETKKKVYAAYCELLDVIDQDRPQKVSGRKSFKLRTLHAKNAVFYDIVKKTYLAPHFIAPCRAGALFAVISANGLVSPCEILNKPLGNLRDYDMDFMKLLKDLSAKKARQFIRETQCHCVYGCAWTANILSNVRFLPKLAEEFMRQSL